MSKIIKSYGFSFLSVPLFQKGSVKMVYDAQGTIRGIAPPAKVAETTGVLSSDGVVEANEHGAIILRVELLIDHFQGPFRTMSDVAIANVFPIDANVEPAVRQMTFPFLKVDSLAWAESGRTSFNALFSIIEL